MLGQRVRLRVRPERALSFTEWLVAAGGQRFVINAAPDTNWTQDHAFLITGTTLAPLHGRTALPQLVVDDECSR
jgi:hypothetical protein